MKTKDLVPVRANHAGYPAPTVPCALDPKAGGISCESENGGCLGFDGIVDINGVQFARCAYQRPFREGQGG